MFIWKFRKNIQNIYFDVSVISDNKAITPIMRRSNIVNESHHSTSQSNEKITSRNN